MAESAEKPLGPAETPFELGVIPFVLRLPKGIDHGIKGFDRLSPNGGDPFERWLFARKPFSGSLETGPAKMVRDLSILSTHAFTKF
jgi:hypothetical protein